MWGEKETIIFSGDLYSYMIEIQDNILKLGAFKIG